MGIALDANSFNQVNAIPHVLTEIMLVIKTNRYHDTLFHVFKPPHW
jgi:hypothetical protein